MHILSTDQFLDKDKLASLFERVRYFKRAERPYISSVLFPQKVLATIFYEPSTRTRLSFESAMVRLGGRYISTESAGHFSSAIKGESLEDTIRVIGDYADVIVLRHFKRGSAADAAHVSRVPLINAGDGDGEHPTQALLDAFTIYEKFGRLDGLSIGIAGDLLYGRTVHSLIQLLSMCKGIKLYLISPQECKLPYTYRQVLEDRRMEVVETYHLSQALSEIDVLYMTRLQLERFIPVPNLGETIHLRQTYSLDMRLVAQMKPDAMIMHPLPRNNELPPETDSDPRAWYFKQAENGLYVRMALLELVLR